MKHTLGVGEFWHCLVQFVKEHWFEIVVFCLFVAFVFVVSVYLLE